MAIRPIVNMSDSFCWVFWFPSYCAQVHWEGCCMCCGKNLLGNLSGVLQLKKHMEGSLSEVLRTPRARGLMGLHWAVLEAVQSMRHAGSAPPEPGWEGGGCPLFHPVLWPLISCLCFWLLHPGWTCFLAPLARTWSLWLNTFPARFFQVSATSWRRPPFHLSFLEAFLVELYDSSHFYSA